MARARRHDLEGYRAKRDFSRTPEPSGLERRPIARADHLRFVIHKHDATRLHYDLRLEIGGSFRSWAVTRGPSLDPAEKRLAVEVENHPLAYGDFEGTIPQGEYGGGTVMIWDRGFWAPEGRDDPAKALSAGELKFIIAGTKLQGSWVLVRMRQRPNETHVNWLLIKHRDKWATPGVDDILRKDRSAASRRTMSQIAGGKGAAAEPFITTGGKTAADAVWNQKASATARQAAARAGTPRGKPMAPPALPKLSHPDRVLWPDCGVTKKDLAEYLAAASRWMLPHLAGRPCSLLRAPEGIAAETFFQRHPMAGQSVKISTVRADAKHEPYLQIDDAEALVALAQISVVELHPWNSAPFEVDRPGRLVFDLDPAPDVPFDRVVEAANFLRRKLVEVGLVPFCKTTGGKGLHVVTPLDGRSGDWSQAKLFAQTLCAALATAEPERFVMNMAKKARKGRIFLDYLRNEKFATAVAPLSPRARPGAPVSMPLKWSQVRTGLDPSRFTTATAIKLLERDLPWADYDTSGRSLTTAAAALVAGAR